MTMQGLWVVRTHMAPTSSQHAPLKGILLILLATVLFAMMDTVGKYLMTKFNVSLVASVRYGINLLLLVTLLAPRHGSGLWRTRRTGLVVVRGLSLAAATLLAGLALQRMPVGETVAIIYLQGFGVMLAAGLLLKERISIYGWIAAAAGFAGVLLIARPGGSLAVMGVVFALLCATVSVAYILLSRVLASSESTMALLFHVAIAGTIVFGVLLPFNWHEFSFSLYDIALLTFIGIASLAGHYLLTSAYRFAPASMLAPFNYFHIAFAVLLGWLIYDHVPDATSLAGMVLIALAGAGVALQTHFSKRKEI